MFHNIAVIIVVYQNYDVLKDLFISFSKQTKSNFHLFICDLSDDKQKINYITLNDSQLTVIPGINKGYSYGVNIGIKQAISQNFNQFCVINSDIYVSDDFIKSLNQAFISHHHSIIGGKIYYTAGYEYHKNKYNKEDLGKVIWYAGGIIDWNNVYIKHLYVDEIDQDKTNNIIETDFITGCLMCFDKKVIDKVGFWDEGYFLYYEDADYCERAKKKGIKLYYDPSIIIWHKNAQSTGGSGSSIHQQYQNINRIKFALKYAPLKTKLHMIKNYFQSKIFSI